MLSEKNRNKNELTKRKKSINCCIEFRNSKSSCITSFHNLSDQLESNLGTLERIPNARPEAVPHSEWKEFGWKCEKLMCEGRTGRTKLGMNEGGGGMKVVGIGVVAGVGWAYTLTLGKPVSTADAWFGFITFLHRDIEFTLKFGQSTGEKCAVGAAARLFGVLNSGPAGRCGENGRLAAEKVWNSDDIPEGLIERQELWDMLGTRIDKWAESLPFVCNWTTWDRNDSKGGCLTGFSTLSNELLQTLNAGWKLFKLLEIASSVFLLLLRFEWFPSSCSFLSLDRLFWYQIFI